MPIEKQNRPLKTVLQISPWLDNLQTKLLLEQQCFLLAMPPDKMSLNHRVTVFWPVYVTVSR
jgi:hypothetical protein